MTNYNFKNIEFSRQALLSRMTRPIGLIALYPKNTADTSVLVRVLSNGTTLNIRYISSGTETHTITYSGKSIEAVVQEINALGVPLQAVALETDVILSQGDLLEVGGTYVKIPDEFITYDRLTDGGVIIRGKKVAVRHKSSSSIKILPPYVEDASLPWYPRISNGAFTEKYKGKIYHYYIAEFDNQSWSSTYGKPFKDLKGVEPIILDKGTYQLPRYPIFWNGENILLYNKDLPISQNVIEDIDVNNGVFYTSPSFYIQDGFTVDYSYLENSYVYKGININGHFSQNPLVLDKFVVIYLLPVESNYNNSKRTVYHVIGDSIEDAVSSIQIDDPTIPIAIIGAYNIQQVAISDKVSILDTRSRGGGLMSNKGPESAAHYINSPIEQENGKKIEDIYSDAYRFWDIGNFDGIPYPGAAAIAIDIPEYLKDVLPIDDIKKKASKFVAAGVYPSVHFSDRDLPSIGGISSQVANVYNLDFSTIYSKYVTGSAAVAASIPAVMTGAGLIEHVYEIPNSILSGNWSSIRPQIPIKEIDGIHVLEINTQSGIVLNYTKSTAISCISWEERTVVSHSGIVDNIRSFSPWKKKILYDDKYCATGSLVKNSLVFSPSNKVKQYKNLKIHSPYIYSGLSNSLDTAISSIVDGIIGSQNGDAGVPYGTAVSEYYSDVADRESKTDLSDYVLTPNIYNNLFSINNTKFETDYSEDLYRIGYDVINSGCYNSGHYFKYYVQNVQQYVPSNTGQAYVVLEYNNQIANLSHYLDYRYRNDLWSGDCDTAASVMTGLITKIANSSGAVGIPFSEGVPLYWYYFPITEVLSGVYINSPSSLGSTVNEVRSDMNYDYIGTTSIPYLYSSLLSYTGNSNLSNNLTVLYKNLFDVIDNKFLNNIENRIYGTRYYSGSATTSHWFVGHNKVGTFLGNVLNDLIKTYEYLYKYNDNRATVASYSSPSGVSNKDMMRVFSGIERCLEAGYDAAYTNIMFGSIVEPSMATTIGAYGWYLNNWEAAYGKSSKLYSTDYREKYYTLFDAGLKQLVKNQINEDGLMLETTSLKNEIGSFYSSTPTKILFPLAEALKLDFTGWRGIAETSVNSILDNYFVSGLYYTDPFKENSAAGRELTLLPELSNIYKKLTDTGTTSKYELISTELEGIRGTEFLPEFSSYVNPPEANWKGTINALSFWKQYSSGDVANAIDLVKSYGINTIKVPFDVLYWKSNSGEFLSKVRHLLETCYESKVRVIPTLLSNIGSMVASGSESAYLTYGISGNRNYTSYLIASGNFLGAGPISGSEYINQILNNFHDHPSVVGYTILEATNPTKWAVANYNNIATVFRDRGITTKIGYSCSNLFNLYEAFSGKNTGEFSSEYANGVDTNYSYSPIYNPYTDYIEYRTNSLFSYFTGYSPKPVSKDLILSSYGDSALSDYSTCISRADSVELPYVTSSLFVKSGTNLGILYEDGTSKDSRQLGALVSSATGAGVACTGHISQRLDFSNKFFYVTGYRPSYNSTNLLNELSNWSTEGALSNGNSGEFYRRAVLLNEVQSALDLLNYSYYLPNTYYIPEVLTLSEVNNLNYYRNEWSSKNPFTATFDQSYVLSGAIDGARYDALLASWAGFLSSVCGRINVNG